MIQYKRSANQAEILGSFREQHCFRSICCHNAAPLSTHWVDKFASNTLKLSVMFAFINERS